ncbi:predicted GPI-anchored protein 58 [Miscanthus floridulus]|uniref:predicted GPI-anchored protein 58 n=1 Tax=Miscanthus floridulus TaxID=154761 RepID=UPI003457876B
MEVVEDKVVSEQVKELRAALASVSGRIEDFSPSWAAASLLAHLPKPAQRASEPARARRPTSRAGLLTPSRAALASAQPRAVPLLTARPRADCGRELPPRGDHVPASPAARQPQPNPAPTRPPTPAGARALAHSRPRCLPSPLELRAPSSALATPAAPLASSSRTTAPFPDSSCPQLHLALLQVALELAPPSEHRLSFPAPRHRWPWRRHARPPWKSSSFSSPASPSYPTALAFSSHISCARQLSLPWPEMAAGLVAEPRRRASAHTGEASASASQPGRPGRAAMGRSPARPPRCPFARAVQAGCGRGPVRFHGPAQ